MRLTFYIADDIFFLGVNPLVGFMLNSVYEAKTLDEKLQIHKEEVVRVVEQKLKEEYGLVPETSISSVMPNHCIILDIEDLKMESKKVDPFMADIKRVIRFHEGIKVGLESISLTIKNSAITK